MAEISSRYSSLIGDQSRVRVRQTIGIAGNGTTVYRCGRPLRIETETIAEKYDGNRELNPSTALSCIGVSPDGRALKTKDGLRHREARTTKSLWVLSGC
jgi:hypothetical protein